MAQVGPPTQEQWLRILELSKGTRTLKKQADDWQGAVLNLGERLQHQVTVNDSTCQNNDFLRNWIAKEIPGLPTTPDRDSGMSSSLAQSTSRLNMALQRLLKERQMQGPAACSADLRKIIDRLHATPGLQKLLMNVIDSGEGEEMDLQAALQQFHTLKAMLAGAKRSADGTPLPEASPPSPPAPPQQPQCSASLPATPLQQPQCSGPGVGQPEVASVVGPPSPQQGLPRVTPWSAAQGLAELSAAFGPLPARRPPQNGTCIGPWRDVAAASVAEPQLQRQPAWESPPQGSGTPAVPIARQGPASAEGTRSAWAGAPTAAFGRPPVPPAPPSQTELPSSPPLSQTTAPSPPLSQSGAWPAGPLVPSRTSTKSSVTPPATPPLAGGAPSSSIFAGLEAALAAMSARPGGEEPWAPEAQARQALWQPGAFPVKQPVQRVPPPPLTVPCRTQAPAQQQVTIGQPKMYPPMPPPTRAAPQANPFVPPMPLGVQTVMAQMVGQQDLAREKAPSSAVQPQSDDVLTGSSPDEGAQTPPEQGRRRMLGVHRPIKPLQLGATTLAVRNVPARYTQEELIKEWGFDGTYDFLHLPYCTKSKRTLGCAFVNFVTQEEAVAFQRRWHGTFLQRHGKTRALDIVEATVQGYWPNLARLQGKDPQLTTWPVLFRDNMRLDARQELACLAQASGGSSSTS